MNAVDTLSPSRSPLKALANAASSALNSYRIWLVMGLAWAGLYSYADRYTMNPDGMSYIDLASDALRDGPSHLINNYWSPGYPGVLAVFLTIFKPSPAGMYPVAHLANFCIFGLTMLAFVYFLKQWIGTWDTYGELKDAGGYLVPFGFAVFLWHSIELIGVAALIPDMCVAAICYFAAGVLCRASRSASNWGTYAALGTILGVGYYFKAAMLPIGLLGLALFWLMPPAPLRKGRYIAVAAFAFLVTVAPMIATLSYRAGKPTTGEVGRLSYAWLVNGLRLTGWTEAGEHGIPLHPPRKLMEKPELLEFAGPVGGTFPLWFDSAYWYAGVKINFNWRRQLAVIWANARAYGAMLRFMNGLMAGALLLAVMALCDGKVAKPDRRWAWQLLWPMSVVCLYWLVYTEPRYVAPFFVMFWLAAYGILMPRVAATPRKVILSAALATMLIPSLLVAAAIARRCFPESSGNHQETQAGFAAKLQRLGLRRGDRVAIVGPGFEAYYAQIAGLKIVAQIPSEAEFRQLDRSGLDRITACLTTLGVKALIAKEIPPRALQDTWVPVGGASGYSIQKIADEL